MHDAMFKLLLDTCVWLDIAKDPRQAPVLDVLSEMIRLSMVTLIVPRPVFDEFQRNRERIAKESAKSLSTHFRFVRDAVGKVGGDKKRVETILAHLEDVDHKIPIIGGTATTTLNYIERLLTSFPVIEISEAAKLRAAQRALEKKAPFHHGRNSMADAVIVETYADCVRAKAEAGTRFAFVTHNKSDFSIENGNHKIPHPDLARLFTRIRSLYFISLPEALRRIEPALVSDLLFEYSWVEEPRGRTEILEAIELLFNQVWYNRHWNMRIGIERGEIKVVDKETYPRSPGAPETIQRDVLKMAIKAAKEVERRYGKKNLGPWDDFDWGMINGKLSALRWVLGDEWDMLDT
jgi:hypothetical protein